MDKTAIVKLNGGNYASWSYQIKLILMEADLWTTVNPGETRPTEENLLRDYVSRQGRALAKIALSVSDEQQMHIRQFDTPKEVWDELERLYAPRDSKFRIVQLRRSLYSQKSSNFDSVESYLGQINTIVTELANVGSKIEDGDLAMTILCGLSDDWDSVISALCNLPEKDLTCATIKRRIIAEATRRRDSSATSESSAMLAKWKVPQSVINKKDFRVDNDDKSAKSDIICFKCKKVGHIAKYCKSVKKTYKSMIATCSSAIVNINRNTWIVDSGATHHMTPNAEFFLTLEDVSENIIIADGSSTPAVKRGTVAVHLVNNRGILESFEASNTLLVPGLKHGILSVKQLTENDKRVTFDKNSCQISQDNQLLIEAKKQDRLYVINTVPDTKMVAKVQVEKKPLPLWHRRMMHASQHQIVKMLRSNSVRGLECEHTEIADCDHCLAGKSTRQRFTHSDSSASRVEEVLGLVHADLMGPIDIQSWGGAKYILSIVDDSSRYTHVFFLKRKNEALGKFKQFKIQTETQLDKRLKRIRTDNGLEFCSSEFEDFCTTEGIVHEKTMVYTPQQNGIAERMNRTIMDLVRSVLHETLLPKSSWAELTYSAVYIRNRLTNKHNDTMTPYEIWHQRKPSLKHLRAIGCQTYVHIPRQKRHSKLESRGELGYLVGYSLSGRGYRVWMPDQKRVIESRDCTFKEDCTTMIRELQTDNEVIEMRYDNMIPVPTYAPVMQRQPASEPVNDFEETDTQNEESETNVTNTQIEETNAQNEDSETNVSTEQARFHRMTLRQHKASKPKCCYDAPVCSNVITLTEPTTYTEAISRPDANYWLEAMHDEIESLKRHNVWTLSELPPNVKPIKCRWVFTTKHVSGRGKKYKARLVAKGFTQVKGIDFEDVYAPVSSFEVMRIFIAYAVQKSWFLDQFDIKSAYLHSAIKHDIYMEQPEGFQRNEECKLFCKLEKSIYGLKQSSRCWNEYLNDKLRDIGFKRSQTDPCVYILETEKGRSILTVYVDDFLMISENKEIRTHVKELITKTFECSYSGELQQLLGVQFKQENGKLSLSQTHYIDELLHKFGMLNAKPAPTPMEVKMELTMRDPQKELEDMPYRELIGGLLYVSQRTRPDISYAVGKLAQYSSNYDRRHWNAAKRVLRYLKGTKDHKIVYQVDNNPLKAYADADWASSQDRKSTTGYVMMFAGAPVLWRSTKQTVIALSTMEAEYIAIATCARDISWVKRMLEETKMRSIVNPVVINSDSQAAIAHASSNVDNTRTKHIAIKYHYIREKVADGTIQLEFTPSERNMADILTKALNKNIFENNSHNFVKH
jgi:hypothetical protein